MEAKRNQSFLQMQSATSISIQDLANLYRNKNRKTATAPNRCLREQIIYFHDVYEYQLIYHITIPNTKDLSACLIYAF